MPDVCVRSSVAAVPASERTGDCEIQRVLHVARGMLGRHVERFEVVVVVLELGPFDDLVAHAREDGLDALAQQGQRMAVADRRRAAGQRDVDRARWADARRAARLDALVERRFDVSLSALASWPSRGPLLGGRGAERLQQRRDQPALPRQIFVAEGAEVGLRAGAGEILLELLAERLRGLGSDPTCRLRLARTVAGCGAALRLRSSRACANAAGS